MKNDRELLELAAKAAGIEGWWAGKDFCFGYNGNTNIPVPWRPLTDDGDALRLAVKLRIDVKHSLLSVVAERDNTIDFHEVGVAEMKKDDPYAATRRAIVRVAAEIGEKIEYTA